ncbi:MAG: cob(I)yrinic acid a,c-diamide adenosyltransferase [Candidatus Latescibacteria bacterium]|nr:cob(I)yrinic acid a,c-diamide adenosyltransferase [Candidatus Latescibacterota bacterium]
MNIYTKTGDAGETSLFGGGRVAKDDLRVEAYGAIDELNAFIGLTITAITEQDLRDLLCQIQEELFTLGADLATPGGTPARAGVPTVRPEQVATLERTIDQLEGEIDPLRSFILPGGAEGAALLHVARTVCRRAERGVVTLSRAETINQGVLQYLNRLSDLLFTLARVVNKRAGVIETTWEAQKR